jgi:hypothetical protein
VSERARSGFARAVRSDFDNTGLGRVGFDRAFIAVSREKVALNARSCVRAGCETTGSFDCCRPIAGTVQKVV